MSNLYSNFEAKRNKLKRKFFFWLMERTSMGLELISHNIMGEVIGGGGGIGSKKYTRSSALLIILTQL